MMTTPVEFVGYVFCFWVCWKILDGISKSFYELRDGKPTREYCNHCDKILEANQKLIEEKTPPKPPSPEAIKNMHWANQTIEKSYGKKVTLADGKTVTKFENPSDASLHQKQKEQQEQNVLKWLEEPSDALKNLHKKVTGRSIDERSTLHVEHDDKNVLYTNHDPYGNNARRAIKKINRSSKKDLMKVRGIGTAHAKRIVNSKPITSEDDLRKIIPGPLVSKLIVEFGYDK
jgi:DNA uptake protein ComE-like DNA-binding protein